MSMEHDEENNVVMLARLQAEAEVDADDDYEDDEYEKPENTEEALSVVLILLVVILKAITHCLKEFTKTYKVKLIPLVNCYAH
jgi:hypothetical protein